MNPLVRKLGSYGRLTSQDKESLIAVSQRTQTFGARHDIVENGDAPNIVRFLLDGWACRYRQFEDGRRQIISFFLPGDLCDPFMCPFRVRDQSIATITPATFASVSQHVFRSMPAQSATLGATLWWDLEINAQIQREWTVSLGRRSALERIAHLLCELTVRMQRVFPTNGRDYDLPLTQADLGEAMGMSTVHVNRSLQDLRSTGFLSFKGRRLTIHDEEGLRTLAMFDPGYLGAQPGVGSFD